MKKMIEIWKNISWAHGYQISNFGNIRSVDREVNHPNGIAIKKGKLLRDSGHVVELIPKNDIEGIECTKKQNVETYLIMGTDDRKIDDMVMLFLAEFLCPVS